MAEILPVLTHELGPCLDRRKRLDISLPVEVARVHNSVAGRIAKDWDRIAGLAGTIEKAVKRMRRIQPGFANASTISQSGSIPKIAGGTFSLDVRLPPPRMM